ncbi:precorrin-6y C5,15-methyltransferase (decarboxylating) subunit CbiE [Pectinatus sottacetonis]|uniref:precorrin-6y C5,15-methyltransferase (decarboxylating) subunit CbiE n=1 Tax=Pectinatus sottacetonis TaxID=1002795 RepID=UPI0018C725DB|nr:precorrin-6y C5,15-methyltransferase (decarboxylating) subunit CbiE [Pectinatus sottacetonis]
MEHKITVVGIGPGSKDYILPIALKKINEAHILVGSSRALADYASEKQKTAPITADIQAAMAFIRQELSNENVVVMVSGDPGYYSLLAALRTEFEPSCLDVIPGISSMQLAFSRISFPWQNADLMSLHGRLPDYASLAYEKDRIIGMLTDAEHNSQRVAMLLLDAGWPQNTNIYICSRLSYPDEKIINTTLIRATAEPAVRHCIMVVLG